MKYIAAAIALLVSGLVAAIVFALYAPLSEEGAAIERTLASLFVYLPFSMGFAMVFGMPLFLVVERVWRIDLITCLMSGSAVGAAASMAIRLPNFPPGHELLGDAIVGAVAGLSFWIVWIRLSRRQS